MRLSRQIIPAATHLRVRLHTAFTKWCSRVYTCCYIVTFSARAQAAEAK
jgi:hypothetical protein